MLSIQGIWNWSLRLSGKKFPELPIVICTDDDAHTEGNPGLTCAYKAARTIGAKVAIPVFQAPRLEGASDFNDMARQVGLKEVAKVINAAKQPDLESNAKNKEWPDPLPLAAKIDPKPYPVDALPNTIRDAVEEVQGIHQGTNTFGGILSSVSRVTRRTGAYRCQAGRAPRRAYEFVFFDDC